MIWLQKPIFVIIEGIRELDYLRGMA